MKKLSRCSSYSVIAFSYVQHNPMEVPVLQAYKNNIKRFGKNSIGKVFLLFVSIFSFFNGFSQSSFNKNMIYGEFGGDGVFLSIQYERQLGTKPGLGVHFELGNADADENFAFTIPVGVNYLFNISHQISFIEAGWI